MNTYTISNRDKYLQKMGNFEKAAIIKVSYMFVYVVYAMFSA